MLQMIANLNGTMKKRRRTHLLATRMGNPVQSHENSGLPAWELPASRMNSSVAAAICTVADVVCTNDVDNCANDDGGRSSNPRGLENMVACAKKGMPGSPAFLFHMLS